MPPATRIRPSRRLAVAAAAEARLEALAGWLRALEPAAELVVVAPTRGAADDLLRRLSLEGRGVFGAHRFTLAQLAAELAAPALAAGSLAPLGGLGAEALAARTVALAGGDLAYFAPVADAPGFARALAVTLSELRAGGVDAADLAGSDAAPCRDLGRLLALFEAELDRAALADPARLLRLAAAEAERDRGRLLGLPLALLDLAAPSSAERRLVEALTARAPTVVATAPAGDAAAGTALAELLEVEPEALDGEADEGETRLERLRRRIFRPHDDGEAPSGDDNSVVFFSAPGESGECVEIVRRIRALAAAGVPFDRVAVLLRDPATYQPLVEETLRRGDVPAYFSRGSRRPHPAGRAFLALLACAAEGLSAARFAEYLSLGQVPVPDETGAPPAEEVPWVMPEGEQLVFQTLLAPPEDAEGAAGEEEDVSGEGEENEPAAAPRTPRRWERLLTDAAVLGGEERWRRRLRGLAAETRRQLEATDDPGRRRGLERRLDELDALERFAVPLVTRLAALPAEATWGRWLDLLGELAAGALYRPEVVLAVLAELRPMDEVGPVPLGEVVRVLEERLRFLEREPPRRRYGRVFVATLAEARGRSFEAVFLPGLAEGVFPRRALEDPLLLDAERRRLSEGGGAPALRTQEERVEDERLLLRLAAGAARRRLVASYPNLDPLHGRSRVPSFYALDLLRAAEGRTSDLRRLEARAAAASGSLLGWPAPRAPEDALDDAEYDLAVLEPLLRGPSRGIEGRGRYLLEANPTLARALRGRWRRWRRGWSEADGVVDPDAATLAALASHRLDRRAYSPTALEHYAACPYRFLLASVCELRPRPRAARLEALDPLTRGSLFHQVQLELFGELRERGLLELAEEDLAAVLELADRVLDRVAGQYRDELEPAVERVWASAVEDLRTDLRGWLYAVAEAAEPWRPLRFELGFGLAEGAAAEEPSAVAAVLPGFEPAPAAEAEETAGAAEAPLPEAAVDGGRLRGSIDLVELHAESGRLRVTDHKTGKAPARPALVTGGGEVLQPLLYALAAERLLDRPVEAGRLFYCTRRGGYASLEVALDARGRAAAKQVLDAVDRAVETGFFPAAPREGACGRCDYRTICGPHEEMRARRKHPGRLVHLRGLRELP